MRSDNDRASTDIDLEILAEDGEYVLLCRQYWQVDANGAFDYSVADLAKTYGLMPSKVSTLVVQHCRAFIAGESCPRCGAARPLRNRADYAERKRYSRYRAVSQPPTICLECKEADRRAALFVAEAERGLRVEAIEAELAAVRSKFPWTSPTLLSFEDAVFLLSVFRAGGADDLSSVVPQTSFIERLSPTTEFDRRILVRLYEHGLLAIHPGTSHDALTSTNGTFTSFLPFKVHWLLPTPPERISAAQYLEDVEALLKSSGEWPADWHEDAPELHRTVAFEECLEYLRISLEEHGFDPHPGEKLSLVLRSLLKQFSIGQTYNFIWRAARDAAAFYVRERTSRTHAVNIVPGALQRMAERAVAESWIVKGYRRDRRAPESQVSHVLFTMALRLPDGGFGTVPPAPLDDSAGDGPGEEI